MKDKKLWKEMVPVVALLVFIAVVLILCAVSAGKKKREAMAEETGPQILEETDVRQESLVEAQVDNFLNEVKETIELEEELPDQETSGNGEDAPGGGEDASGGGEDSPGSGEDAPDEEGKDKNGTAGNGDAAGTVSGSGLSSNGIVSQGRAPIRGTVSSNRVVTVKKTNVEMLAEMMDYWSKGNVEAIEDLSGLAHYRAMSASLASAVNFYYYGDRNADGKPHGTGIAVYGRDQYYYGEWKNGMREGEGMWIKMYYEPWDRPAATVSGSGLYGADPAFTSHSYRGTWKNDMPNGEGHERYDIDIRKAEAGDRFFQNVIGNFQNGRYHGDMYVLTLDKTGNVQEWRGQANQGVFKSFEGRDTQGRVPICQSVQDEDSHLWIAPLENKDLGVRELIDQKKK